MAFGDEILRRIETLRKRNDHVKRALEENSRAATLRAVEASTAKTPPTADNLKGTNTRSGGMKQHWATDSILKPKVEGNSYVTILANNKAYASYVNNGHRMDKHFVPGLTINSESGLLEYDPDKKGGIIVGTKTTYVTGIYAKEAGIKAFENTAIPGLEQIAREVFCG